MAAAALRRRRRAQPGPTRRCCPTSAAPRSARSACRPRRLSAAGRAYYPNGVDGLPGAEVVAANPAAARSAAYGVLLAHPAAAAGALGRGLTATLGADLSYLPSAPVTPTSVPAVLGTTVGPQGADRAQLLAWLDGLRAAVAARRRRGGRRARRGVLDACGVRGERPRDAGRAGPAGRWRRSPPSPPWGSSPPRCSATATSRYRLGIRGGCVGKRWSCTSLAISNSRKTSARGFGLLS